MLDIKSLVGGAVIAAAATLGVTTFAGEDPGATYIPMAPALNSPLGQPYQCKPDMRESIDRIPPGALPDATDTSTKVIVSCAAPDGTIVKVAGDGTFIEAKDGYGNEMSEREAGPYLR